jgi:peptide alpha-N-acetyltransferase
LQYQDENDLPIIMNLIDNELSEPYSIFTYRYFLINWPQLCFLVYDGDK